MGEPKSFEELQKELQAAGLLGKFGEAEVPPPAQYNYDDPKAGPKLPPGVPLTASSAQPVGPIPVPSALTAPVKPPSAFPSAGPHNINDPVVRAAIEAGSTGEDLYDFEGRLGEKRGGSTPEQQMLKTSTTVVGYGGGGGGQAFQPNDPSFKDLPFPLVEPYEYRALLQNRGMDPAAIDAEVKRYEDWRQTAPGLGDRIDSDKLQSDINLHQIEGERLVGRREVGLQQMGAYGDMMPALQDIENQRKKAWDDADRQYQDHLKAYDAEITDLHNTTINPTRIFDTNESNRALAAIAVGLGEFANQFTGHGNAALKIVSDAIDRDIEAQKAGVNTKYMALGVRSNLLNRLHDRFGDINLAADAAKAGMYEQLAMYTKYLGAQIGDKDVVAQANKNAEELRANAEQAKLAFQMKAQLIADQKRAQANAWAYSASRSIQQEGADLANEILGEQEAEKQAAENINSGAEAGQWMPIDQEMADNLVDATYVNEDGNTERIQGLANTRKDAETFNHQLRAASALNRLFNFISEANQKGSQWLGQDPQQKRLRGLIAAARIKYIEYVQQKPSAQTTETEIKNIAEGFDSLNNSDILTGSSNIKGRLAGYKDVLNAGVADTLPLVTPVTIGMPRDRSTGLLYRGVFIPETHIKNVESAMPVKKDEEEKPAKAKGKKEKSETGSGGKEKDLYRNRGIGTFKGREKIGEVLGADIVKRPYKGEAR